MAAALAPLIINAQTVTIDASIAGRQQTIDGFGTCLSGLSGTQAWMQNLYYDDAYCSILRVDLVPQFISTYSEFSVNSPWFHNNPSLPGPDGNNVRTYTSASDYTRNFGGRNAKIAVMGSDIAKNILMFDLNNDGAKATDAMAKAGASRKTKLGDFKFTASIWSPAPWLKVSSGNAYGSSGDIMPKEGANWPFIWGGNYAGGKLDVSGTTRAAFFDGVENTSALTQFARMTAAYVKGVQDKSGVKFYAISIQNELNFETFYNSCTYPLTSQYAAALKAVKKEFMKYADLKDIKLMGPEDLLGGDAYGMWQYGASSNPVDQVIHKNLQYLTELAKDAEATAAMDYYCIHGYASDGVSSAGSNSTLWDWWSNGWTTSPAGGIPANIKGFRSYNKKSWMTETSGEEAAWLEPASGFPKNGGFSVGLKIHQALTNGYQSGWVYWQFAEDKSVHSMTLTDKTALANSPKYVAFKHFSRFIRPNSVRLNTSIANGANINVSSYVHDVDKTLSIVIVNSNATSQTVTVNIPTQPYVIATMNAYTSGNNSYWKSSALTVNQNKVTVTIPGYGISTLNGTGLITSIASEASSQGFNIYPNPSANNFTIISEGNMDAVTITSQAGIEVYRRKDIDASSFSESNLTLKPGLYFVEVLNSNGTVKRRTMVITE